MIFVGYRETVEIVDFVGNVAGADMLLMTLRLAVALSVTVRLRVLCHATKSSKCNRRIKENFSRGFPAQAFSWAGID